MKEPSMIKTLLRTSLPLVAAAALAAPAASAADITVTVDGIANAQGTVMVGLYNKAGEFPKGKRIADQEAPAAKGAVTVVFKDVPAGQYALSAFHDVNKNHRLDVNMQGIPTEPVGSSRDAIGNMGPPKFEDAVFTVGSAALAQTIHVK